MPTVLREAGYRFYFFSGDGHEPAHVHIDAGGRKAKVWLNEVRVARNGGFSDVELRRIVEIISSNSENLLEAWNDYFG